MGSLNGQVTRGICPNKVACEFRDQLLRQRTLDSAMQVDKLASLKRVHTVLIILTDRLVWIGIVQ